MNLEELADRQPPAGPRVLTLDLERVPGRVTCEIWDPRDVKRWSYIGPEEWECLPRTVCASLKWYGRKAVDFVAAWDNPDDPYHVARVAWKYIDAADLVITYNGNRADVKWLQQDWDLHLGLPAPRPFKSVDLFKLQQRWALERRSLRHLLERMSAANKDGHYNSAEAWAALGGDVKAQRALKRYNVQDTRVTEQLWENLRHLVKGYNMGALYMDDENRCPKCGSTDVKADGWYTAEMFRYALYRCQECGALARSGHIKSRANLRGVS